MESNQEDLAAAAVRRDFDQVLDVSKTRLLREIVREIAPSDRLNRVHDDLAIIHRVPAADLHMEPRPDANRTSDSSLPNALAKVFGE